MKLEDLEKLKAGDRVRVTFEGEYRGLDLETHDIALDVDDDSNPESTSFYPREVAADTFKAEKIPKRIRPGDRVVKGDGVWFGEVLAIQGDWAVLSNNNGAPHVCRLRDCRHQSEVA